MTTASPRYRSRKDHQGSGSGSSSATRTTSNYRDDVSAAGSDVNHHSMSSAMTEKMSGSKGGMGGGGKISGGGGRDGVMTDVPLRDFDTQKEYAEDDIRSQVHEGNEHIRKHLDSIVQVSRRVAYSILCLALVSGVVLATVVIAISKPGCFGATETAGSSSSSLRPPGGNKDEEPVQAPVITEAPTPAPTTTAPTAEPEPLPPAEPGFPDTCSNDKIAQVREQLTVYSCYDPVYPWSQKCSFSHVTKACQGYIHVREFYSNLDSTAIDGYPYLGVIIGWQEDDGPVDTLYIGSHNSSRYNTQEWNSVIKYTGSCRALLAVTNEETPMPAQVMVVEWSDEKYRRLREAKLLSGYTDDEIILDRTDAEIDPENAISDKIDLKFPGENRPIHYMQIDGRNFDHLILTKSLSIDTLKRVRFLAFEYNWKGDWEKEDSTLYSLIDRLKSAGLTCYWSGNNEYPMDLWRITDCWSWHYESKQWAHISCVNTQYDDVLPLRDRMELMFEATMQKNQTFGGKPNL